MPSRFPALVFLFFFLIANTAYATPEPVRPLPRPQPVRSPESPYATASGPDVRFGGTVWDAIDLRWEAVADSVWTFDSGVGSRLEGWDGVDRTRNDLSFFRRLGTADFDSATCVGFPAGLGGGYSLWAGARGSEAAAACYANGQGYGNQWRVCMEQTFWYDGVSSVGWSFQYAVDGEPGFDGLELSVVPAGGEAVTVGQLTGTASGLWSATLDPGDELPAAPGFVTFRFCATSDATVSDEDGLYASACGLAAVDDVSITGGSIFHSAGFESGNDGWALAPSAPGPGGEWSALAHVDDLPSPAAGPCAIQDSVLVFADDLGGHPPGQDNVALSPWIDLQAAGVEAYAGRTLVFDGYANLPASEYVYIRAGVQWYPYTCPATGAVGTSPLVLATYAVPGGPACSTDSSKFQIDLASLIGPGAEQVRIALGVVSHCGSTPACTGGSNTSPWFDNVSLVVSDTPADTTPPKLLSARAERFTRILGGPVLPPTRWVEVRYSEPMGAGVLDPGRYTLTNTPRTVIGVEADSVDASVVHLELSGTIGPSPNFYDVFVTGVSDAAGNPIVENGTANRGSFFLKLIRFEGEMSLFLRTQSMPPDVFAVEGNREPLTMVLQDHAVMADPQLDGEYLAVVPMSLSQDKTTGLATATLSWRFSNDAAGLEPRPDRTHFLTAATGVTDTVFAYWNDQELLSRAQARDLVIAEVIVPSPYAADLVGLFHHFTAPTDSLLLPGLLIGPYDSSFVRVLDAPTYLVWLDNVPNAEFMHPTSFVFVNAATGDITVDAAESWPLVNGVDIGTFAAGDAIWNAYSAPGTPIHYTPVATANSNDWAVIVVGENLGKDAAAKALEKQARKNDVERIKEIMNGAPLGPRVHKNNIIEVSGTDTMGATLQQVCDALNGLKAAGCDKVYFWYLGHGGSDYACTKDGKLTYKKLACKLLELNPTEVCIVIEACHSGSAIDDLAKKKVKVAGGEKGLKGTVITSSKNNVTTREEEGAPFLVALNACMKDTLSDLDDDGHVDFWEASTWARALNPIVDRDNPQGAVLDDGRKVEFKVQKSKAEASGAGGTSLRFVVRDVSYKIVKNAANKDSLVTRKFLYVENDDLKKAVKSKKKIYVICKSAKGKPDTLATIPIEVPAAREVDFGEHGGKGQFPGRVCLMEIPDSCRKVVVAEGPANDARYGLNAIAEAPDSAEFPLDNEAVGYYPGEPIFYGLPVDGPPGEQYATLVSGLPSWGVNVGPPAFTTSAVLGTKYVMIRGTVPDTATVGGDIEATLMNLTTGNTTVFQLTALVNDSAGVALGAGSHVYQSVAAYAGLSVPADTLRLRHSVVTFKNPATAQVGASAGLLAQFSTFRADSGVAYTLEVAGDIQWDGTTLVEPANGLHLTGAGGRLWSGGVLGSQGDGMIFQGDLQFLDPRFCLVDESAGNGLVFDGATNLTAHNLRVDDSGGQDVVLRNTSVVELRDCEYNVGKEQVEAGSTLTRSWTTDVFFADHLGHPLYGVIVEVRDALGAVVGRDTTGGDGFGGEYPLVEYVRNGGTQTPHTPHQFIVQFLDRDTLCVYTADALRVVEFILTDSTQTGTGGHPEAPPARMVLAQNAPNPTRGPTTIRYGLPQAGPVRLRIFDVRGRLVETLVDQVQPQGWHDVSWNPPHAARGVYFYRLEAGGAVEGRKLLLLE